MTQKSGKENPLTGQTALITGAGHTAGRVMAGILAAGGAKVILCDVDPNELEPVALRIREAGGLVEFFTLTSESEIPELAALSRKTDEAVKINILVNAWSVRSALITMQSIKDRLGQEAVILNVLNDPGVQNGGTFQTSMADLTRSAKIDFAPQDGRVFGLSLDTDLIYVFEHPEMVPMDELSRLTIGMKDLVLYLCGSQAKEINGRVFELRRTHHQGE